MNYGLLTLFLFGIGFIYGGWKISFTKEGLEWMYDQGIWKRWPPSDPIFTEKQWTRLNRIRGSSFIALGLIFAIGSIVAFFIEPYGV